MRNLKKRIWIGYNLGVLVPTIFYFASLWYYEFISTDELILSFTTPRVWMLFVIIYFPLLNLFLSRRLNFLDSFLQNPSTENLEKAQKIASRLPGNFIFNVMLYSVSGASSLLLVENFFTLSERVLGLCLGFAFTFVYALPFFVNTVILIERWTQSIPLSARYSFPTVKTKLYINILCNVFGVAVVLSVLNVGVIMSQASMLDSSLLLSILIRKNLLIGFVCMIIVLINLIMLSRQIIIPVKETTDMFRVISTGDLTMNIKNSSKDEIGILKYWCNIFVDKIHDVVSKVRFGAGQVDSSAEALVDNIDSITEAMGEMSHAANQIAASSEGTCETISEVITSLGSLDSSIVNIVKYSRDASEQSNKTVEISLQGQQIVNKTITEMDQIKQEMQLMTQTIEQMGSSVVQIEKIVKMISDVARQTNMLAINASIEAARAGEQGKGFGVVADSIGKLSEESTISASEITKLVEKIKSVVFNSVAIAKSSMEKVGSGVEMVKNTGQAFNQIHQAIDSTTVMVEEIAAATDRQASESKSIMKSVNKVNEMSLNVSALVQEQVAATEEIVRTLELLSSASADSTSKKLARESKELYELISQFKL